MWTTERLALAYFLYLAVVCWLRPLGRFGGSWLLLARKRRSSLTPLRLGAVRSDLKVNPTLVHGARRECA